MCRKSALILRPLNIMIILLACVGSYPLTAEEMLEKTISSAYYKSYNYEKSDNINDAIKTLLVVYYNYPNTYTVNNRLAHLYTSAGQYRNAIEHYKKAISALPGALSPKLGLLYVYNLSQNYEEASKLGYQVLSIDYYSYLGNLRLAYALRVSEQYELSAHLLTKMLLIYPSDPLYLTELGLVRFKQKSYREAKSIMKDVLILDPENVLAKQTLAVINQI